MVPPPQSAVASASAACLKAPGLWGHGGRAAVLTPVCPPGGVPSPSTTRGALVGHGSHWPEWLGVSARPEQSPPVVSSEWQSHLGVAGRARGSDGRWDCPCAAWLSPHARLCLWEHRWGQKARECGCGSMGTPYVTDIPAPPGTIGSDSGRPWRGGTAWHLRQVRSPGGHPWSMAGFMLFC